MSISSAELLFYAKQISLSDIGIEGQLRLKNKKILCIGAGGLGSPLLQTLAAAGIGTLGIIDHDEVEFSNLQRQILYRHEDVGLKKAMAAKKQLQKLNPYIEINSYPEKFDINLARELIAHYDIIADCTDYLANRYLVNQYCVELNKPFVFAGIWQHQGQCMMFHGEKGPCFECLFPIDSSGDSLADCSESGVLSVLPGLLGVIQANLIIQYSLNPAKSPVGYFYNLDIKNLELKKYYASQNPNCQVCVLGSMSTISVVSIAELKIKLANHEKFTLLDVRSREEYEAKNLGGKLIPLPELAQRMAELDPEIPIVVHCRTDVRSQMAARILSEHQFKHVAYLDGGIEAYYLITA